MCYRKKINLLVILGAGASIPYGMPSVSRIDELFKKECLENAYLLSEEYPNKKISIYDHLETEIERKINYEEFLYYLLLLDSYYWSNRNRQYDISKSARLTSIFSLNNPNRIIQLFNENQCFSDTYWGHLISYLTDKLLLYLRELCRNFNYFGDEIKRFYESLEKKYDVSIISLNYDDIIDDYIKDKERGFTRIGKFDSKRMFGNKNWNFYYNIHGSVHFNMKRIERDLNWIYWEDNLDIGFEQNSIGRSKSASNEGLNLPTSCIITGYEKTLQMIRTPFVEYYSDFTKRLRYADALIFIGYGFNDQHLNQVIRSSFLEHRKRPIIIITYGNVDTNTLNDRRDTWAWNLNNTLGYTQEKMRSLKSKYFSTISELIDNMDFETSILDGYPLSVFYNGTKKSYENPGLIIEEIERQLRER